MQYGYKYRLNPSETTTETLLHHVDTCRQLYNHVLHLLNKADDIPARYEVQGQTTSGIPFTHLQSDRLQTQENEWSDDVVVEQDR